MSVELAAELDDRDRVALLEIHRSGLSRNSTLHKPAYRIIGPVPNQFINQRKRGHQYRVAEPACDAQDGSALHVYICLFFFLQTTK